MRASRLLALLITLEVQGRVSARELAARFEVSKRTIYRDVDELSAAGVPVYAEHGVNGGFELAQGWSSQLNGLTPNEIETSLLAVLPGPAAELGLAITANAARQKLMAAATSPGQETTLRIAGRFHFDSAPWHRRSMPVSDELRTVAQAVWENRRLKVRYQSWEKESVRTVEPLGLVLKAGEWYFVCLRSKRAVIFKVANVRNATLTDEQFSRPRGFDLASAWTESVANFQTGLQTASATLRVHPSALPQIDRLGAVAAELVTNAIASSQGIREALVPIESVSHAAELLFAFGADIEVLEPPSLRLELGRRASLMHALYMKD